MTQLETPADFESALSQSDDSSQGNDSSQGDTFIAPAQAPPAVATSTS